MGFSPLDLMRPDKLIYPAYRPLGSPHERVEVEDPEWLADATPLVTTDATPRPTREPGMAIYRAAFLDFEYEGTFQYTHGLFSSLDDAMAAIEMSVRADLSGAPLVGAWRRTTPDDDDDRCPSASWVFWQRDKYTWDVRAAIFKHRLDDWDGR